jgi:hypothetical protein
MRWEHSALVMNPDESALRPDKDRHCPESGGPECDEVRVAGRHLQRHARIGVPVFPIVPEARLLGHGQKLIVRELPGPAGYRRRKAGLGTAGRLGAHLVVRRARGHADKVAVTVQIAPLDSDGLVGCAVPRPVDPVAKHAPAAVGIPREVKVALAGCKRHGCRYARGREWLRRLPSHLNFADVEGVWPPVVKALHEDDPRQVVQPEGVVVRAAEDPPECRKRELKLDPMARRQGPAARQQVDRGCPLTIRVLEEHVRRLVRREPGVRQAPQRERVAVKVAFDGVLLADLEHGPPVPSGGGAPC